MAKAAKFNVADYLDSPEIIAGYLNEALATGDTSLVTKAIGDIARAKGMSSMAREIGVARESLYKSLSAESRPEFAMVMKSLNAIGIELHAVSKDVAA